jgi:hypothetical protein
MNPLQAKGIALKRLIDASIKEKEDFTKTGSEIKAYGHKADDRRIFEGMGMQAELWFRTTVAMTAQAIDLICPYLYPANPYRCGKIRPHPFSPPDVQQLCAARNSLMESYLNFTPEETDLYGESVRAINQSQVYGAGVLWTGFNERKGLVQSSYDSIENLQKDPDATTENTVNWVSRTWEKPRWKWLAENPKAAQIIAQLKPSKTSKSNVGKQNDLIVCYEVWMRVGLHRYMAHGELPTVDEQGNPLQYTDAPRKYLVSDCGKIISESTWEIPFFMDDLWPCEVLSYIEDEESIWPISPMRAGLPFQKALNWLYIFYMTKIRFCSRSIFAIMDNPGNDLGDEAKKLLESWDDLPFLSVRTGNDQLKLADIFQQLDLNPRTEDFERAHAIIKREFQEHTGLYDIMHYGEGETQDRSARATDFKDKTSKTRINYRIDRVVKWQSKLSRKEALGARFLHTPEQIDTILGAGSGEIWGRIMPPAQSQGDPMAVDFQQWFLETDYSIVSTSMRRHDVDSKIEALKEYLSTTGAVQMKSPDPMERAMCYDASAEYFQLIGGSDQLVQSQKDMAQTLRDQAAAMQAQQQAMLAGGIDPATGQPMGGAPVAGAPEQPQPAGAY